MCISLYLCALNSNISVTVGVIVIVRDSVFVLKTQISGICMPNDVRVIKGVYLRVMHR